MKRYSARGFLRAPQICFVFFLLLLPAAAALAMPPTLLSIKVIDQNLGVITKFTARLRANGKTIKEMKNESHQELVFSEIREGKYILEIAAEGFKSSSQEITIKLGRNDLTIRLEVAGITESIKVELDTQEASVRETFSNFLTKEQIANLPDTPDELEAELKRIAGGDNVVIRIDGFTGGRMPAKSQIASIRIVRSSYDAENHALGLTYVDIVTKAGGSRWSGAVSFNFNDEALNARNPFARTRSPEQTRNTFFFLDGPLGKKTSLSFLVMRSREFAAQNIVAAAPAGAVNDFVNSNFSTTFFDASVTQNLTENLPIKVRYSFSNANFANLGVGGFNLPERAFATSNQTQELRFSVSGAIGKNSLNDLRFLYKKEVARTSPQSETTAIIVLDSFSKGGAGNASQNTRNVFWVADNLLFGFKQHALKIGGSLSYERLAQTSALNQNGTFIFSRLQDFQLGRPSIFSQNPGIRNARLSQWQIGSFIQDDIRIDNSFILSLGLRYEWQNNVSDSHNFSPRLSFTWSPLKSGKMTFRGGAGIFYNWLESNDLATILSQDTSQPSEITIVNPGFPDPFFGVTNQMLPQSYRQKSENLRNPYVIHSSFGIQRQLSRTTQLRVEYVYQKGLHQFRSRDVNAPISGVRPNPNFGRVIQTESSAVFLRNSLNVGLTGSITKDLSLGVNYSASKTISESDGVFGLPSNSYNARIDRSVSNNDQRHKIYASLGWKIKTGLRLTTILTTTSPLPYTITTGRDDNGDTNFNDRPIAIARNSERGRWQRQVDARLSYTFSFINRQSRDASGSFTVVTTSDAPDTFDFNPEKRFSIGLFGTVQNLLNSTNFANFVGVETSPFFHQAISARQPRKVSVGLRFNF